MRTLLSTFQRFTFILCTTLAVAACSGSQDSSPSPVDETDATTESESEAPVTGTGDTAPDESNANAPIPITPTALIDGIADGGIYGPNALTATASKSTDAAAFSWALHDGTDTQTATGESFEFTPKSGRDYTLTLTTTSSTKHTASRSILFHCAAPPVAIVTGPVTDQGEWPKGKALTLQSSGSTGYVTKFIWTLAAPDTETQTVEKTLQDTDTALSFTPSSGGLHTITLVAVGPGGNSAPVTMQIKVATYPFAVITGAADGDEFAVGQQLSLSGTDSVANGGTLGGYGWAIFEGENTSPFDFIIGENLSYAFDNPGDYRIKLSASANLEFPENGGTNSYSFGAQATIHIVVLPKPTVKLSGADLALYPVGQPITISASGGPWTSKQTSYQWSAGATAAPVDSLPAPNTDIIYTFTPTAVGQYTIAFAVTTAGGTTTEQVTINALKQPVAKITSDIQPGFSYRPSSTIITASATDSLDAETYQWTWRDAAGEVEGTYDHDTVEFTPKKKGAYTLELVATNALTNSAPATLSFNIREELLATLVDIDPKTIKALHIISPDDIYAVGDAILHYGKDQRWITLKAGINAVGVWARNTNDVYVAESSALWRISAESGLTALAAPTLAAGEEILDISGTESFVAVRTNKDKLYRYNGVNWELPLNSVMAIASTGQTLYYYSGLLKQVRAIDDTTVALSVNLPPSAPHHLHVWEQEGQTILALTTVAGHIFASDGTEDFFRVAKLPTVLVDDVDVREFDTAMSVQAETFRVVTQLGNVYEFSPDFSGIDAILQPVISAASPLATTAAALHENVAYLADENANVYTATEDDAQWTAVAVAQAAPTYPGGFTGSGLHGVASGTGAAIINLMEPNLNDAKRVLHIPDIGPLAYLATAPVTASPYPPLEAAAGTLDGTTIYFLSKESPNQAGVYKIQNGTVTQVKLQSELTTDAGETLSDIAVRSAEKMYVLTNKRLFFSSDGGTTFTPTAFPASLTAKKLYVSSAAGSRIIAVLATGIPYQVIHSIDNGTTWKSLSLPIGNALQNDHVLNLAGNSSGTLLVATTKTAVAYLKDGAAAWTKSALPANLDTTTLALNDILASNTSTGPVAIGAGSASLIFGAPTTLAPVEMGPSSIDCLARGARDTVYLCEKQTPVDGITNLSIHQFGPMQ